MGVLELGVSFVQIASYKFNAYNEEISFSKGYWVLTNL